MDTRQVVYLVVQHMGFGAKRFIPQVFGTKQAAEESIQLTVPGAMKLKGKNNAWQRPGDSWVVEIRELPILTTRQVLE
jgi:hypothetical protein